MTTLKDPVEEAEACDVVQIGLTTRDLSGSLRLYSELFGFANAGGIPIWGAPMALQGMPPATRGLMWWLVGRQSFFQLELFEYSVPKSRPLRADWSPADHGWVRFGVAVSDFDRIVAQLSKWDIPIVGETRDPGGVRRLAFRDPYVGAIVEILEDGPNVPGGVRKRANELDPAIIYVTASVSDLSAAREFYTKTLNFTEQPREVLHRQEHEALWGMAGAVSDGFVVRGGDIYIEVVQYAVAAARPKPADWSVTDQGIMNIGLGSRSKALVQRMLERVQTAQLQTGTVLAMGDSLGVYILSPERELELIYLPEALDGMYGFRPGNPFIGVDPGSSAA